jgi:hypothetical protein
LIGVLLMTCPLMPDEFAFTFDISQERLNIKGNRQKLRISIFFDLKLKFSHLPFDELMYIAD